ncbi:MAG TPA: selenium metabolism-associated LysR family transcriptional regulator [Nitrospirota bacterium]|nr:selenium metabolism-associated LysR family transcriptional regulator [Nitrospirota bacterium]
MDLHQIEIFCTLIKLRSFSKAAEALYLTQPTVSGHIKNLEQELAVKLLDRLGKQVMPTAAGDILFRHGQELLALRDQAREEIASLSGQLSGLLKIGGSTIPGAYVLPSLIGAFKKQLPSATIQLFIDDTMKIAQAVLNGDLHLGIVGAPVSDPRLESHPYLRDELVIAVPATHAWAKKKTITPDALHGTPFILREAGSGTRRIMEDRLGKAGITIADLNTIAVMGSSDAVRQSIKGGLGVSILSIRAFQDDISAKRLYAVRLKGVPMERSFPVILRRGKSRSPLCQAFLNFLLHAKSTA